MLAMETGLLFNFNKNNLMAKNTFHENL